MTRPRHFRRSGADAAGEALAFQCVVSGAFECLCARPGSTNQGADAVLSTSIRLALVARARTRIHIQTKSIEAHWLRRAQLFGDAAVEMFMQVGRIDPADFFRCLSRGGVPRGRLADSGREPRLVGSVRAGDRRHGGTEAGSAWVHAHCGRQELSSFILFVRDAGVGAFGGPRRSNENVRIPKRGPAACPQRGGDSAQRRIERAEAACPPGRLAPRPRDAPDAEASRAE